MRKFLASGAWKNISIHILARWELKLKTKWNRKSISRPNITSHKSSWKRFSRSKAFAFSLNLAESETRFQRLENATTTHPFAGLRVARRSEKKPFIVVSRTNERANEWSVNQRKGNENENKFNLRIMFADSEGEETNKIIDKHLPLHLIRLFAHKFLSFLPHRRLPRSRQTNPSDGWERLTARCCVTVIEKEKTHNTRRSVDDREKEEKSFKFSIRARSRQTAIRMNQHGKSLLLLLTTLFTIRDCEWNLRYEQRRQLPSARLQCYYFIALGLGRA